MVNVKPDSKPKPPAAVAPTIKAGGIADRTLYLDDGPKEIVLTSYFTHKSAITYAVSALPAGYVEVSEANGTLTLKPVLDGRTRVAVVATADGASTDPVRFRVDVMAGSKTTDPDPDPDPDDMTKPDTYMVKVGMTFEVSVEGAVDAITEGTAISVRKLATPKWEIKGEHKGKARVLFYTADLSPLDPISVEVENQAPTAKTDKVPKTALLLEELTTSPPPEINRKVYVVGTDSVRVDFSMYFEEKDTLDKLTYTMRSSHPQYAVVAGYKKNGSEVYVDVANSPTVRDEDLYPCDCF